MTFHSTVCGIIQYQNISNFWKLKMKISVNNKLYKTNYILNLKFKKIIYNITT